MRAVKIAGIILFLLALNCSLTPVNALNTDYYGIESRIKEDTTVSNVVTLTFNSSIPDFVYKLRYPVSNIHVDSDFAPAECDTKITDTTTISCAFLNPEAYRETGVKISFDASGLVKRVDNDYEFSNFISMDGYAKKFLNTVYLPQTAALATDLPNESFSPRSGITLTNGRNIIVSWDNDDVVEGDDFFFTVTYRLPSNNMGSIYDVGLMVVIAVIIIASLGIFYVRNTRRQDSMKVVMPLMKNDEKVIINILNKNGGTVNQKVIVRESDFSKAKVSRIIAGLKERGIVGVESMGRMNKIMLKIRK
jgi:uncharacterized membrane protein